MPQEQSLFVFDLDDTLLYNKHHYAGPRLDAIKEIIRAVGPKALYAKDIFALSFKIDEERKYKIDPATDKPYLYNRRRFPGSLVATYEEVCKQAGARPSKKVRAKIWAIGNRAFSKRNYAKNIHPHAKKLLSFLQKKDNLIVVLTKGDSEVQNDKFSVMRRAGFGGLVTEWRIVDDKTTETFEEIRNRYDWCDHYYSIGNMYASDIKTSLRAGFYGIYIPDEHWETSERKDDDIDWLNCIRLNDLDKVIGWYKENAIWHHREHVPEGVKPFCR